MVSLKPYEAKAQLSELIERVQRGEEIIFSTFTLVPIDVSLVIAAAERTQREMVSFWDSLILEAALSGGATRLFSEDPQDGRVLSRLTIENPFRDWL